MIQQTLKSSTLFKFGASPTTEVVTTNANVFINPQIKSGDTMAIGNGLMGQGATYIDPNHIMASFEIPVDGRIGSGTAFTPKISEMLKACGLLETITAATSSAYKPSVGTGSALTECQSFVDGYKRTVVGCVANMKLSAKIGEPVKFAFAVQGFLTQADAVAAANPAVTLDTGALLVFTKTDTCAILTTGGQTGSLAIDSFELDAGNKIQETYAIGMKEFYIQDFDPTLMLTAVKTKGTDEAAWQDFTNGLISSLTITIGSAAGKKLVLQMDGLKLKEVSEADDNGKTKLTRKFRCQYDAATGTNYSLTWQ